MSDQELRRLYGFLTGDAGNGWEPVDHALEVQDGRGMQELLGTSDWVNFLDFENFMRLARLAGL